MKFEEITMIVFIAVISASAIILTYYQNQRKDN